MTAIYFILALTAVALLAYLVVALLRPDLFP